MFEVLVLEAFMNCLCVLFLFLRPFTFLVLPALMLALYVCTYVCTYVCIESLCHVFFVDVLAMTHFVQDLHHFGNRHST